MSDDKSKRNWIWIPFIVYFLVIEGIALVTKERVFPTLSRVWWRIRKHWKIIVPSIIMGIGIIWLWFHFVLGECALGIC